MFNTGREGLEVGTLRVGENSLIAGSSTPHFF
jgi:hypothetical protein